MTPINYIDPSGNKPHWLHWLGSGLLAVGGIALMLTGVGALAGAAMLAAGVGSMAGGYINEAMGGSFNDGWLVGGLIAAGAVGLIAAAPAIAGFLTSSYSFGATLLATGELVSLLTITGAEMVAIGGALALSGYMYYEGKKISPRINSNTKKKAYEGAFHKGGKNPPIGPENHGYGNHFHPNVPPGDPRRHYHYYYKKSKIFIAGLLGFLDQLFDGIFD